MDIACDYNDADLLALYVWQKARHEGSIGRRSVAHTIHNRALNPGHWGSDVRSVILKHWHIPSLDDSTPMPKERDWLEIKAIVQGVLNDSDYDITNFSTFFHENTTEFPATWGLKTDFAPMLKVGQYKFYQYKPTLANHDLGEA